MVKVLCDVVACAAASAGEAAVLDGLDGTDAAATEPFLSESMTGGVLVPETESVSFLKRY